MAGNLFCTRGHPPHRVELSNSDRKELARLAAGGRTEQRIGRRARVLLSMEKPQTVVQELADRVEMTRHGIWYVCQRYEERGIEAVFDAPRSGRPRDFSPLGEGADRTTGVLRPRGHRTEYNPLVDP